MMRAIAFALMLILSACGLQPMYAGGASGAVASGLGSIQVAPIPERGLGAAINDRLQRAAAPRR